MNNINISNPFVILFVAGTLLSFFVNQILDFINFISRKKTSGVFPKELPDDSQHPQWNPTHPLV